MVADESFIVPLAQLIEFQSPVSVKTRFHLERNNKKDLALPCLAMPLMS